MDSAEKRLDFEEIILDKDRHKRIIQDSQDFFGNLLRLENLRSCSLEEFVTALEDGTILLKIARYALGMQKLSPSKLEGLDASEKASINFTR